MQRSPWAAVRASATVWRDVVGNSDLRRLEIGRVWSVMGEAIASVALGVYAFTHSGALAVAGLVAVQMLPGALAAPLLSGVGDRFRRERVLLATELSRALIMALTAVLAYQRLAFAGIAVLAGCLSVASATFYPARRALVPLLVRSLRELTSANVASSTLQSGGLMLGPVVAGVLFAIDNDAVWPVFAAAAVSFALSAVGMLRIRDTREVRLPVGPLDGTTKRRSGTRLVRSDPNLRTILAAFAVKNFARGAVTVLVVTIPLALLDLRSPAVGYLSAMIGVGGLTAGFLGGAALLHGKRLGRLMVAGLALWSVPMLVIAGVPTAVTAAASFAVIGLGNAVVDVSGYTQITRITADDVLARVYGLHESSRALAISAGSLVTAVVVDTAGTRTALVIAGVGVAIFAVTIRGRLARVDRESRIPTEPLELLTRSQVFGPLQPVALERLAATVRPVTVDAGTVIVKEGDQARVAYLIAEGLLDVVSAGKRVAELHDGDHFGEIALLDGSLRTATVVAVSDARLYAVDGDEFLTTVGGHPASARHARRTADGRLDELKQAAHDGSPDTPA